MNFFPEMTAEDVLEAVNEAWDLEAPLPTPKGNWLRCPVCHSDKIHGRYWHFGQRNSPDHASRINFRCNVSFKCIYCSVVWVHGVVIPEDLYNKHREANYTWRQAQAILERE